MEAKNYTSRSQLFNEKGLNLAYLIAVFWRKKWQILKIVAITFLISIFVAVLSKNMYKSSTVVVPQTSGASSLGGSLGGLAAMAGINLGGMKGNNEISPTLYPKIFNSLPFQEKIMKTPLDIPGVSDKISFEEYYLNYYDPGLLSHIRKYTLGLPGILISSLRKESDSIVTLTSNDSLSAISVEQRKLMNILDHQLTIEVNNQEGFITITGEMPEARAAAQLTNNAKKLLEQYIIDFHIQKAKIQLDYLERRLAEKKEEFVKAQITLANFKDKNLYNSTARSNTQFEKLQSEYDLTYGVYSELSKQVENQRLAVKQDTPLFTVIQPPVVPDLKSSPNRIGIILIGVILGFIIASGYIFCKEYIISLKYNFNYKAYYNRLT